MSEELAVREYVWMDLRERVIEAAADAPHAAQEQRIIDVFVAHPALVAEAVEHVLAGYARGTVRAVWPVLVKHVEELASNEERATLPVRDTSDRKARVARARQWLKAVGVHFDREPEVEDELFGDRGMLRAYATDRSLVDELLALWRAERPRGKRVEAEHEERMARQAEHYRRQHELRMARAKPSSDVEQTAAAPSATEHGRERRESDVAAPHSDALVGAAPASRNPFLDDE